MRNYRQWLVFSKVILTLLGLTGWYGPAQAAVNIDRTRIIFASDDIAQSLTLSNDNTTPMLLQVWTDAGNIDASPDNSKTPLVALPPVFKMQPGELRTLRLLLSSRQQLATDRSSQPDMCQYRRFRVAITYARDSYLAFPTTRCFSQISHDSSLLPVATIFYQPGWRYTLAVLVFRMASAQAYAYDDLVLCRCVRS
ncbi:fimbria/pilus periplasmic chaperone [Salmonella enterica]|nr:hypothetical protein [Salmonella enterica]EAX9161487.1 hypothetical protein [Salmonella enterica]EBQ6922123.1 fimbria/pilus periplasmic chaperone [Salmonella enterica]